MAAALPQLGSITVLCLLAFVVVVPATGKRVSEKNLLQTTVSHHKDYATDLKEAQDEADGSITAVVLKTYGDLTPWMDFLIARYQEQLSRVGVQLYLLVDVSQLNPNMTVPHKAKYAPFGEGEASTPLCEVTWNAAEHHIRVLTNGTEHSWNPDQHYMTTVFEMLWWQYCFPQQWRSQRHFVWFFEQDTFFNGDLAHFVESFLDEDADYIARGFRIATALWWMYGQYADALNKGLATLSEDDDVVTNVRPLPHMNEGICNNPGDIKENTGLLFAQEHVVRYSSRLLEMMRGAARRGVIAPGEALKGTLCANGLGLGQGEACSMLDLAPIREDSVPDAAARNWISPVYCWAQVRPVPGRQSADDTADLPCSEEWRNKWVHPVKLQSPALRLNVC